MSGSARRRTAALAFHASCAEQGGGGAGGAAAAPLVCPLLRARLSRIGPVAAKALADEAHERSRRRDCANASRLDSRGRVRLRRTSLSESPAMRRRAKPPLSVLSADAAERADARL